MKILSQVNCIKDASESEIEQAKNKNPNSDFCYCTFPIYEGSKLLGVDKKICVISVLGDLGVSFFEKGAPWCRQMQTFMAGAEASKNTESFYLYRAFFYETTNKRQCIR